jgi:hypothetical protein
LQQHVAGEGGRRPTAGKDQRRMGLPSAWSGGADGSLGGFGEAWGHRQRSGPCRKAPGLHGPKIRCERPYDLKEGSQGAEAPDQGRLRGMGAFRRAVRQNFPRVPGVFGGSHVSSIISMQSGWFSGGRSGKVFDFRPLHRGGRWRVA